MERQGELKRHLQEKIDEQDASARMCDQLQADLVQPRQIFGVAADNGPSFIL